jgi:hypothetical protein
MEIIEDIHKSITGRYLIEIVKWISNFFSTISGMWANERERKQPFCSYDKIEIQI